MTSLCRVELLSVSNVPKDSIVNDFVIQGLSDDATSGDLLAITDAVADFWNEPTGSGISLGSMIGASRSRAAGGMRISFFEIPADMGSGPMGSPFHVDTSTLVGADGSANLPEEVAAVLTLRGVGWDTALVEAPDGSDPDAKKDRPRQRRTGRLYIGPLKASCLTTDGATGVTRLTSSGAATFVQTALTCIDRLNTDLANAGGRNLAVWSRKSNAVHPCVRAEMDNAFDTQRRRGFGATSRLTVNLID